MKKYLLSTSSLILLLFWPIQAQEIFPTADVRPLEPQRLSMRAAENYLVDLQAKGRSLESQGLYIESLDGSTILADHQSDVAFNPASVIKIATSFAALDKFGAGYRFETSLLAAGTIDKKTKTLTGDLVLAATGDPVLTTADVNRLVQQAIKAGVTRVTGSLVVAGPFTYASYIKTPQAVKALEAALKKQGLRVTKATKLGAVNGAPLATHQSATLLDIIFLQNAQSNNQTADRLGEAVGGPQAVEDFLVAGVGIPAADVHVGQASGLGYNRITARGTVQLLRNLVLWLNFRSLLPSDVLPTAGGDIGTLHARFTSYHGAVVAKTGTLPVSEGGVSALAGFLYTENQGVLVFAIYNTKGDVNTFRALQDRLLTELLQECGGMPGDLVSVSLRKSGN